MVRVLQRPRGRASLAVRHRRQRLAERGGGPVSKLTRIEPRFVEVIPDTLQPGVVFVSIEFATSAHLCCCGCGYEVTLPLAPDDWSVTYDGESVSFAPSVGNSSFPCRSHYWIKRNRVVWHTPMTAVQTERARARARRDEAVVEDVAIESAADTSRPQAAPKRRSWLSWFHI